MIFSCFSKKNHHPTMPSSSWNEIKAKAAAFSKVRQDTNREEADANPFLDAFSTCQKFPLI
jgi:hypothetical protein